MAKDTISIGFEDKIWKAADVLRGNLNASEYEGVVLGLIFLKYISDRFETKYAALVQDPLADPDVNEFIDKLNLVLNASKSYARGAQAELEHVCDDIFRSDAEMEKYCQEKNIPF